MAGVLIMLVFIVVEVPASRGHKGNENGVSLSSLMGKVTEMAAGKASGKVTGKSTEKV